MVKLKGLIGKARGRATVEGELVAAGIHVCPGERQTCR